MNNIKTNADVIRAMTDEELAVFLNEAGNTEWFDSKVCNKCRGTLEICPALSDDGHCIQHDTVQVWLQSAPESIAF